MHRFSSTLAILTIIGLLTGCTQAGPTPTVTPTPTSTSVPTAMPTFTPTPISAPTLSEILAQAANVTQVKYDLVTTSPQGTQTARVWVKANKWRIESPWWGQTTGGPLPQGQTGEIRSAQGYLLDTDANITYTLYSLYSPSGTYGVIVEKSPLIHPGEVIGFGSAASPANMIAMSNPKVVGTETVDGKASLVVEYVPGPIAGVQGQIAAKAWIWKERPFVVRIEMTIAGRTSTIEFKNVEFADIPDSVFEPREALRSLLDKMSLPSKIE